MKYITLEKNPNIKINKKIEYFYNPDYIYIPFDNKAKINVDSLVLKDMPLGDGISSVSGKILGISDVYNKQNKTKALVIANDFREKCAKIKKRKDNIDILSLVKSVSLYDEKLFNIFKSLNKVERIIINAIDDELYVANNIINFKENINDVLEFLDKLIFLYKAKETLIVIKNTESELIEECLDIIGSYPLIKLTLLENVHLLSQKEFLLNKLKVSENNTLYLTMNDLVKLEKIVNYNLLDSTKIITICGDLVQESKVIIVKKYTLLKNIITKYITIKDNNYILICNSLINGFRCNLDLVITDDINVIYIMKEKLVEEEACIKCGKCLSICPKNIDIVDHLEKNKKCKLCLKCGLCNYICPSHINLTKVLKGDD